MRGQRLPGSSLVQARRCELRASSTQSSRAGVGFLDPHVPRVFLGSQTHLAAGAHAPRSTDWGASHTPPAGRVPLQALHCLLLTPRPSSDSQEPTRPHTSSSFLSRRRTHTGDHHILLKVPGDMGHRCLQQWPHLGFFPETLSCLLTPASCTPQKLPAPRPYLHKTPNHSIQLDKISHCERFLPQIPILQTFQVPIFLPRLSSQNFCFLIN